MFFLFPLRDEYRVKKFPVVVTFIIIINCFIYFFFGFRYNYPNIIMKYGFIPSSFSLKNIITSMFLHGSIFHLGFNMWYLWLLGDNLEDRWGRLQFFFFYILGGIFASMLYMVMIPSKYQNIPTIGASGAVACVLGAYSFLFPKSKITFKYFYIFLFRTRIGEFYVYAYLWLGFWFFQQLFYTICTAKGITTQSVAFAAHFAGFVFGLTLAIGTKLFQEAKYRENVILGKNVLLNILGEKKDIIRNIDQDMEIENAKKEILANLEENRVASAEIYSRIVKKYPEVVLPEKVQYEIAKSFERQDRLEDAIVAYKNFILNYPFHKLADNAIFSLGKLFLEKGDYEKAKNSFLQIVLFYPYSDVYEEAKFYLENELPKIVGG